MSLEWCDSFGYGSTAQLPVSGGGFYDTVGGNNHAYGSSGSGRWGGVTRYLQLTQNGDYIEKNFSNVARRIVGIAVWFNSMATNLKPLFRFYDGVTLQVEVRITTSGEIEVLQNTTQRGITAAGVILQQNWYYLEVDVTIHGSTGAVTVRKNGVAVLTLTNINTQTSGAAQQNRVRISGITANNAGFETRICDYYVLNTSGSVANALLGDSQVEMLVPDGAGNSTQFTPSSGSNWQRVNERATSDGDSNYVQSATNGHIDLYTMGALTSANGSVAGVAVKAWAKKTDVDPRELGLGIRSGGSNDFDSGHVLTSGYLYHARVMDTNPITASAFTESEVNGIEAGMTVSV
jgi:hypothetical protein